MSTAYYIVLNAEDPGFDPFVNGKYVAQEASKLDRISKQLGIKLVSDYCSQDFCEFGEEFVNPDDSDKKWFSAVEGIEWAHKIIDYLQNKRSNFITFPRIHYFYFRLFQNAA